MPVAFTSNGYDTTATNPYSEGAWADAFPVIGQAKYAVRSPLDWKVTAVSGQDRTVSIAAGRGLGHGVTDKTVANDTIQLDTIVTGSRWDMIACRRDWTPTAGESAFVKVNGGATATIPGGRQATPGNIDDQPIALVQVTAGQTQPTAIIDLRTWVGDGGGLVANHDLVRSFLNTAGTRININGVDWLRRVGVNDTNEWVQLSPSEWEFVRGINAESPISGTTNLVEGTITNAPPGLYLITGQVAVRAASGANGYAFVKAAIYTEKIRYDLDARYTTVTPIKHHIHAGGDLYISAGYEVSAGTATVTPSSGGITKVRAAFLG
jgi:hypothetical protein